MLADRAGIPEQYRNCTLDSFQAVSGDEKIRTSLSSALKTCRQYVDTFRTASGKFREFGLLFSGPPGVGKTHLAVSVLLDLIDRYRIQGRFADFTTLMFEINSTIEDPTETLASVLRPVIDAEVLVLDELGIQKPTDWVLQNLYWIINVRYNKRRPTIFTTNYRLDSDLKVDVEKPITSYQLDPPARNQFEKTPERLALRLTPQLVSRLYEMAHRVSIDAEDFRQKVKGPGRSLDR